MVSSSQDSEGLSALPKGTLINDYGNRSAYNSGSSDQVYPLGVERQGVRPVSVGYIGVPVGLPELRAWNSVWYITSSQYCIPTKAHQMSLGQRLKGTTP